MVISHFKKIIFSLFASVVLIFSGFTVFSQTVASSDSSDPFSERSSLEDQLKILEQQIADYDKDITKTSQQKQTLQNQITLLQKQISKLNLQIQQGNVMIKDLGVQMTDTQNSIKKTSAKIDDKSGQLKEIIRTIYQEDQKSGTEILLSGKTLSDFFDNLVALESLNSKNKDLLVEIKSLKVDLVNQENSLDKEKTSLEKVVKVQTLQKQQNETNQKSQQSLLKLTEAQYQQTLKAKQDAVAKASVIRARIFDLIGISNAPNFGQAYDIAKSVSQTTGIRPAFLLAMLTQESNLGKNVGQCYLTNQKTGDGIYIKSGKAAPKTMSPSEVTSFIKIINSLNSERGTAMDPSSTPVSCVMYSNGQPYGWGGAMGPSQFIPSTWMKYSPKVQEITGRVADPWDIADAFLATGLYLKDLGGATNEFSAAMHYFSGASWAKWEEFYGNSVLSIAAQYEDDIAQLNAANQ
jgi:peptidoglycan hydrolase CwlO-like protein